MGTKNGLFASDRNMPRNHTGVVVFEEVKNEMSRALEDGIIREESNASGDDSFLLAVQ